MLTKIDRSWPNKGRGWCLNFSKAPPISQIYQRLLSLTVLPLNYFMLLTNPGLRRKETFENLWEQPLAISFSCRTTSFVHKHHYVTQSYIALISLLSTALNMLGIKMYALYLMFCTALLSRASPSPYRHKIYYLNIYLTYSPRNRPQKRRE